ncbi:hypothetical protein [Vibrio sp. SCSIO 43136]|uniref:hypothetical protein n=1 Tax=Vibrio sp. SCSIO 43136 TaxID=2819101 RepID=UPI0020751B60|nr:hypothetical protein [Vibrio sp. SCSIO 43136]USD64333.1 hypothetical protein J4N39_09460 [Vibrio sp. SCSIO 43136]
MMVSRLNTNASLFVMVTLFSSITNADIPYSQKDFLTKSVQNTPFTAVVQYLSAEKVSSITGEGDTYSVSIEVLELIKGNSVRKLNFDISVQTDEKFNLNKKPVILSLCQDKGGYYWAGVGAEFPYSEELLAIATDAVRSLRGGDAKSFTHCN